MYVGSGCGGSYVEGNKTIREVVCVYACVCVYIYFINRM